MFSIAVSTVTNIEMWGCCYDCVIRRFKELICRKKWESLDPWVAEMLKCCIQSLIVDLGGRLQSRLLMDKCIPWSEEMALRLRPSTALTEDPSLGFSTHTVWLITA